MAASLSYLKSPDSSTTAFFVVAEARAALQLRPLTEPLHHPHLAGRCYLLVLVAVGSACVCDEIASETLTHSLGLRPPSLLLWSFLFRCELEGVVAFAEVSLLESAADLGPFLPCYVRQWKRCN